MIPGVGADGINGIAFNEDAIRWKAFELIFQTVSKPLSRCFVQLGQIGNQKRILNCGKRHWPQSMHHSDARPEGSGPTGDHRSGGQ